jgi:hypothetical protein
VRALTIEGVLAIAMAVATEPARLRAGAHEGGPEPAEVSARHHPSLAWDDPSQGQGTPCYDSLVFYLFSR